MQDYTPDPMLEQRIEWIRTNFDSLKTIEGGVYVKTPEFLFLLRLNKPELYQQTFPSDIFPSTTLLVKSLLEYKNRENILY